VPAQGSAVASAVLTIYGVLKATACKAVIWQI